MQPIIMTAFAMGLTFLPAANTQIAQFFQKSPRFDADP
jgi:multidrug efflux pump subunit AcrB